MHLPRNCYSSLKEFESSAGNLPALLSAAAWLSASWDKFCYKGTKGLPGIMQAPLGQPRAEYVLFNQECGVSFVKR